VPDLTQYPPPPSGAGADSGVGAGADGWAGAAGAGAAGADFDAGAEEYRPTSNSFSLISLTSEFWIVTSEPDLASVKVTAPPDERLTFSV